MGLRFGHFHFDHGPSQLLEGQPSFNFGRRLTGLTMQINKVAHVSIDLVAKRKTMVSHAEAH